MEKLMRDLKMLKQKKQQLLDLSIEAKIGVTRVFENLDRCKQMQRIVCRPSDPNCENPAVYPDTTR